MKWYVAWPILIVFGIGFMCLLDVYRALDGGAIHRLEPAGFVAMGAWMLAVWSGIIIARYR